RLLMHFVAAAFGTFGVGVVVGAAFAFAVVALLGLPVAEVLIAFAPGSVDAMLRLAVAMHLDPVYVGAHHVVRIFLVSLTMPFVARRIAKAPAPTGPTDKPPPTFQD